ncbi:CAAX prenyl protease-related protein [PVC group bacterium]|nr:CAAX prenyl protease-related protein [PVC group bacterium]
MGTGILMLAYLKPWRWYSRLNLQHIVPALLIGILVFVAWVGLETTWIGEKIPSVQSAYLRFGLDIFHFGQMPPAIECTPYAPSVCGWHLALIRLLGSAFVIATIEEFFWRGFLYRMFIDQSFLKVDIGRFVLIPFILVCLFFGLEHTRWIAGIFAGVAYGYLIIRTRDIWAGIIAHITTNFLLGIYVLMTGSYQFW